MMAGHDVERPYNATRVEKPLINSAGRGRLHAFCFEAVTTLEHRRRFFPANTFN